MKISRLKRIIEEEKQILTDKALFTSGDYERMMQNHANALTSLFCKKYNLQRPNLRVRIIWASPDITAYTDGDVITINANSDFCKDVVTKSERNSILRGLLYHEVLHIFYTNFDLYESALIHFSKYQELLPKPKVEPKDEQNLINMLQFAENNKDKFKSVSFFFEEISNILEDAYIEAQGLFEVPSFANDLDYMRLIQFNHSSTFEEMLECETEPTDKIYTVMNLILSYALFGDIKVEKSQYQDERVQTLFHCLDYIDANSCCDNSYHRLRECNNVIVSLWPMIEEYLLAIPDTDINDIKNNIKNNVSNSSTVPQRAGNSMISPSSSNIEEYDNMTDDESNSTSSQSQSNSSQNNNESDDEADSNDNKDNENDMGNTMSSNSTSSNGSSPKDESDDGSNYQSEERVQGVTDDGKKRPNLNSSLSDDEIEARLQQLRSKPSSITKSNDGKDSGYEFCDSDIRRIINDIAQTNAEIKLESENQAQMNQNLSSIKFSDAHKGVSCNIKRMPIVSDRLINAYENIENDVKKVSRALQRSVKQELENACEDELERGLYQGRYLDMEAISTHQKKCFKNKIKAMDTPRIAVALRVDESGSMSCGSRISKARYAACILYDFCISLGFPIAVYGDTADEGNYDVTINNYADFNAVDKKDKYRIMDLSARSTARDGYCIKYAGEQLAKQEADTKILLVISDGEPNADYGYSGKLAKEDIQKTVFELKNKGIVTFVLAIGDDKSKIQEIYKNSFLDITNLNLLPKTMTKLLKQFI